MKGGGRTGRGKKEQEEEGDREGKQKGRRGGSKMNVHVW